MRRLLLLPFLAVLLVVPSAQATHGARVWSGQWSTNTGGVGFRWVKDSEGIAAIKSQGGSPCAEPSEYFRGGYVAGSESGKVTGCTVGGPRRMVARYVSDDGSARGSFDIRFVAPKTFSGLYRAEGGGSGSYTGRFTQHFSSDGCCGGGDAGAIIRVEFRIAYQLEPTTTTPINCAKTPGIVKGHGNAIVQNGRVNANGLVDNEAPFLARCRTAEINLRVLDATLSVKEIGTQKSVRTVVAHVAISSTGGHAGAECGVGTKGTLTVVDSDEFLRPQGLYADSFTLGGWAKPCRGHRHSWSQASPGAVPPAGSNTGTGSHVSVQIICQRAGENSISARQCS